MIDTTTFTAICNQLERRLDQLSRSASNAKCQLVMQKLQRSNRPDKEEMLELFGSMALGMTSALGDIADRMGRLNDILQAFEGGQSDASAVRVPVAARRSSGRVRVRRIRLRH